LFRTLRLQVETTEQVNPYASAGTQRFLYIVWHDSAVLAAFGGKHQRTIALTSRHRDGSFVEAVAGFAGVASIRGSTGATGGRALRELLRVAKRYDIVVTPDGPRGPSRTMSPGVIFLSSRSGNPLVPTAFACSRSWQIPGSWTPLAIPKPFARVVLLAGTPIQVPPDLDMRASGYYVNKVQVAMDRLAERARERVLANHTGMHSLEEEPYGGT
jgi:lysophospholipid acyltransferase (LPLAT)-like uncharacterized protein